MKAVAVITSIGALQRRRPQAAMVVRYLIAGGSAAVVNIAVLYLFADLIGVHYLVAGTISFVVSVIVSFVLQKRVTFRDVGREGRHRKFAIYAAIQIANLGVNLLLLYVFTDVLGIYHIVSQALALISIAIWSFFLYKMLVFSDTSGHPAAQ